MVSSYLCISTDFWEIRQLALPPIMVSMYILPLSAPGLSHSRILSLSLEPESLIPW